MMLPELDFPSSSLNDLDALCRDAKPLFDEHGYLVVRNFVPQDRIATFRDQFCHAMQRVLRDKAPDHAREEDIDKLYATLKRVSPKHAETIFTLGRDLPIYHKLIGELAEHPLLQKLVGTTLLQIPSDLCLVRVDPPNLDATGFDWHQDYSYNMCSKSCLSIWCPLTDIEDDMGPLHIVPQSHGKLWPVEIFNKKEPGERYVIHNRMRLANHDALKPEFEAKAFALKGIKAGDTLFFHSHMVHRSGWNRGERCRWVFTWRYGDMLDQDVVDRHWYTARIKYPYLVKEVHPEMVTIVEEESSMEKAG